MLKGNLRAKLKNTGKKFTDMLGSQTRRQKMLTVGFVSIFAIIGILMILAISAATNSVSKEAESGTIVPPAQAASDGNASGGQEVRFGGNSTAKGTIITATNRSLNAALSSVATAKKITYYSTDINNQPIVVSGVILQPKNAPVSGGKIIAWAHGTVGIADVCAPSGTDNLYYDSYANEVETYLQKGWTVSATDYPGLGTAGVHPYGVGESVGRSVIDSVRAARNMYPTLSTDWIVSGHSQGGQSSLFAGQIADTYGMGLNLKGVVALAPASATPELINQYVGSQYQGYLAFFVYGINAVDPSIIPSQILAAPALSNQNLVLNTGCWDQVLSAYSGYSAIQMVNGGVLPQTFVDKTMQQNPGMEQSSAPVHLVYGGSDELMPPIIGQTLQANECAVHSVSTLTFYQDVDHVVLEAANADTLQFMMDRFAGLPAPNQC